MHTWFRLLPRIAIAVIILSTVSGCIFFPIMNPGMMYNGGSSSAIHGTTSGMGGGPVGSSSSF